MLFYFLQGIALALPATLTPSSFKVFLISQTMTLGWKRTLPISLVPLLTDGPIIILVLLLLTQVPAWLLDLLQILGGFFVFYLAVRLLILLKTERSALKMPEQAIRQNFAQGLVINFLNPNPYLFWGVVAGPVVLEAWQQSANLGLSFITGFYVTVTLGMIGLVIAFGVLGGLDQYLNKILMALSAFSLLLFGAYQIVTGVLASLS